MSFQQRTAERKKAKLKLGISGPSGAGKTYSALLLASGITGGDWSKITLIDTENGSGELYADLGPYNVIPFPPPFDPRRYIEAIQAAVKGGADVIVIDSISHEWDGKGGCLELQAKLGGKYQDWAKVTPLHNDFVNAILQSPVHVIVTTRKKQDYALEQNERGKPAPKKVGMKEIQRDGFEYELTINFDVDISHFAVASKDRTGLFMPRGPFMIEAGIGKELITWANSGAPEVTVDPKSDGAPSSTGLAPGSQTTSADIFQTGAAAVQSPIAPPSSPTTTSTNPAGSPQTGVIDLQKEIRKETFRLKWKGEQFVEYSKLMYDKEPKDLSHAELYDAMTYLKRQPSPTAAQ